MNSYIYGFDVADIQNMIDSLMNGRQYVKKPSYVRRLVDLAAYLQKFMAFAEKYGKVVILFDDEQVWLLLRAIRTMMREFDFSIVKMTMWANLYYRIRNRVPRSMWLGRDLYLPNVRKEV